MKFSSIVPPGLKQAFEAFNAPKGTHVGGDNKKTGDILGVNSKVSSTRPTEHHSISPSIDKPANAIPARYDEPLKTKAPNSRQVTFKTQRDDYRQRMTLARMGSRAPTPAMTAAHTTLMTEMEVQRGKLGAPRAASPSDGSVDTHEYAKKYVPMRMLADVVREESISQGNNHGNDIAAGMDAARLGLQAMQHVNLANGIWSNGQQQLAVTPGQPAPTHAPAALTTAWSLAHRLAEAGPTGAKMLRTLTGTPATGNKSVDDHDDRMMRDYFRAAGQYVKECADAGTPVTLDPASIYAKLDQDLAAIPRPAFTPAAKALMAVRDHLQQSHAHVAAHGTNTDFTPVPHDHEWALGYVRNRVFDDAPRDANGQLTPQAAGTQSGVLEKYLEEMHLDGQKALHNVVRSGPSALDSLSKTAKRRREGADFGVQEMAALAQARAIKDGMLGTIVAETDKALLQRFNIQPDASGNIQLPATATPTYADLRNLVRREISRELQALPSMIQLGNSAELGKRLEKVQERLDAVLAALPNGAPAPDNRFFGVATLDSYVKELLKEQNGWKDAVVAQSDKVLRQRFNVTPDASGNITLPATAVPTREDLSALVRRELNRELQAQPFGAAAGAAPSPVMQAAVQARLNAALAALPPGAPVPDARYPGVTTLANYVAQMIGERDEWNAAQTMPHAEGRALMPEHFAQWAADLGGPGNLQTRIDPSEPPPVQGSAEQTWAPFRAAYHAVRFGDPNPLVTQELKRLRPDANQMREALKEAVGEVMRRKYPNNPDQQLNAAKTAISNGVNKLLEGRGKAKKAVTETTGEWLQHAPFKKIRYQGERLVDSNIGNPQREIGQDALKVTFAALGLEWPKGAQRAEAMRSAVGQAMLNIRGNADTYRKILNDILSQNAMPGMDDDDEEPASEIRTPEQRQRAIIKELVRDQSPDDILMSQAAMDQIINQAMAIDHAQHDTDTVARVMAHSMAKATVEHLLPPDTGTNTNRADAADILEKLTYTRLSGITGTLVREKLAAPQPGGVSYTPEQVTAGVLAAAMTGRKSDAAMLMRAMSGEPHLATPVNVALVRINTEENVAKAVEEAFTAAQKEGRTAALAELLYKSVAKNELGSTWQFRTLANRGFGLDTFVASWARPIKIAKNVFDEASPVTGSVGIRPGLGGKFKTDGATMTMQTSAIGADIKYANSKVNEWHAGLGAAGSVAAGWGVKGRFGLSADVLFHGKEVVSTEGLCIRNERPDGVGGEPPNQKKMARAMAQSIAPKTASPDGEAYANIRDQRDAQSPLKRLLQENPMLSVGEYLHVEDTKTGNFGFGGNLSGSAGPVSVRALQLSRAWSGSLLHEKYDDASGFVTAERRVLTRTSKRDFALTTGAVRMGHSAGEWGASGSVFSGKTLAGGDSYKRVVTERRHLIFIDGELGGNSFMAHAYNHIEDMLTVALNPLKPAMGLIGAFGPKGSKSLEEVDFSERDQSWGADAVALRAKKDWGTLFDQNDPNYDHPDTVAERERVLAETRRNFGEFIERMDLRNSNQVLALCSDISPEARETVTALKSALKTETDPKEQAELKAKIDKVLDDPDSWTPINVVLNMTESRKNTQNGFRSWMAGLFGVLANNEYKRTSGAIVDYR